MNVALIGYRGCGKTTVGRRLADRLWQKYHDVDDVIVRKAGKTIREIFEQDGEEHFRDLETEAIRELVQVPDYVLGLGGGSLGREENRQLIRGASHKIIYLRCDPEVLHARIEQDARSADNRPNLTTLGGGIEEVRLKLADREPIYRQMKDLEIDVSRLSPEETATYIARLL